MSKIEKNINEVTGVKRRRNEDDQDYFRKLLRAIHNLDDESWENLSDDAQAWYNAAAKASNDDKDIPNFSDAVEEEEVEEIEPRPRRSRGKGEDTPEKTAEEDDIDIKPEDLKPGDNVEVEDNKGNLFSGEVIEVADRVLVIDYDDTDKEIRFSRIGSIKLLKEKSTRGGANKKAANKKKETDDKEETPRQRRNRGGGKETDDKEETPPKKRKPIIASIHEMIAKNIDAKKEKIAKLLEEDGVEVKPSTLDVTYADTQKVIAALRKEGVIPE